MQPVVDEGGGFSHPLSLYTAGESDVVTVSAVDDSGFRCSLFFFWVYLQECLHLVQVYFWTIMETPMPVETFSTVARSLLHLGQLICIAVASSFSLCTYTVFTSFSCLCTSYELPGIASSYPHLGHL